jgi:uncharacterized membrane protein
MRASSLEENSIERRPKRIIVLLLLATIGLCLAGWLTYLHYRVHVDPLYSSVCAIGEKVNCETVAASIYSVFAGLPVSVWGAVAYLLFVCLCIAELIPNEKINTIGLMSLLSLGMIVSSLVLAGISSFVIGAVCLFCTATYLVNLAIVILVIVEVRRRGGFVAGLKREFIAYKASPWFILYASLVGLMIIAAGPFGRYPRYWEFAAWHTGIDMAHGFTEKGLPWIGAPDPRLTVHEYFDYSCPACRLSHKKLRQIVETRANEVRIIRHDYSRLRCRPKKVYSSKPSTACIVARAGYCAGRQGRFWEWNDAAMAYPKPRSGEARDRYEIQLARELGLDKKKFADCINDDSTIDFTQSIYNEATEKGIRFTPTYLVDGKEIKLPEIVKKISSI